MKRDTYIFKFITVFGTKNKESFYEFLIKNEEPANMGIKVIIS